MTEQVAQSQAEIDADDARRFEALGARSDYAEAPGLAYAMWPGDFRTMLDVSDLNDRWLTMPFPGMFSFVLYLACGWHTAAFLVFILRPVLLANFRAEFLLYYFMISMPAVSMLVLSYFMLRLPAPIFNRQAQVIHFYLLKHVFHIPWRSVTPYVKFTPVAKSLSFFASIPSAVRCSNNPTFLKYILQKEKPMPAGGLILDPHDRVTVEANLQRLEFIRRYMEEGLSAIQSNAEVPPRRPEHNMMKRARAEGLTFYRLFMEAVYWFGAGPLVDLWVKWLRSKAVWPEEVQRLCEPGADLSEFDTRPVRPHTDVFYRYDREHGGYYWCNRKGQRIARLPDSTGHG